MLEVMSMLESKTPAHTTDMLLFCSNIQLYTSAMVSTPVATLCS